MRILAVDDEEKVANFVKNIITSAGYICDIACTGKEALDIIRSSKGDYKYDLIILDRVLNDMDGLDLLMQIRVSNSPDFNKLNAVNTNASSSSKNHICNIPVIFFSSLASVDNRIKAYEYGVDDFIAKSDLHKGEFLARIRAVLRRCFRNSFSKFVIGNLVVDFHMQVCKMNGVTVPLTNKEYAMLELLCLHGPGAIVSKEKFISNLYSNNEPSESKIIDVFACKLRNKLAILNNGVSYIETVWGRGYTLNEHPYASVSTRANKKIAMQHQYFEESVIDTEEEIKEEN